MIQWNYGAILGMPVVTTGIESESMMSTIWSIRGEYMESCNCEVLCPCLLGPRDESGSALAVPTEGHCDVPMIFRIHDGHYGDVALALVSAGADINRASGDGTSPLQIATMTFFAHVDKIIHNDTAEITESKLTSNFLRGGHVQLVS